MQLVGDKELNIHRISKKGRLHFLAWKFRAVG